MKNLRAFTLAEVLITLGVIGVVAAMTLPIVVNNGNKQGYVAGLRKNLSIANQTFKKILADEGVDSLDNTEFGYKNANSTLTSNLGKYVKIINSDCKSINLSGKYKYLGSSGESALEILSSISSHNSGVLCYAYLADGSYWMLDFSNVARTLIVDVNGDKKPNQWGRDVFLLSVINNGTVRPYSTGSYFECTDEMVRKTCGCPSSSYCEQCVSSATPSCRSASERSNYCGEFGNAEVTKRSSGIGCAKRIEEEGWKMNY